MSSKKEIEIKHTLENSEELIGKLNECAVFKGEYHQIDTYYNPPHRDFLENSNNISEWLRLRQEDGNSSINYKSFYPKESFPKTHCDEYETQINNLETLKSILEGLDFKPLIIVDKVRCSWDLNDIEISVDVIKNLGNYVELEYKGEDENVPDVLAYLTKTLHVLTPTAGIAVVHGYPHLIMIKEGRFPK